VQQVIFIIFNDARIPPFEAHDHHRNLSICDKKHLEIIKNTPKCHVDLMKKCWDSNSSNRPTDQP
ncbi:hypothetical protein GLOIN_2v1549915, partial [Rhizophagus irregularis DAOM 181602=DAOM 197198]